MLPDGGKFSSQQREERQNETTIEVGVKGQEITVVDHIRQVAFQVNGVEGPHRTGSHTEQRSAQREVNLSIDSCNVPNYDRETGQHSS